MSNTTGNDIIEVLKDLNNTNDETTNYTQEDIKNNLLMAVLSYLSFLVLIPILVCKDSKYVKFHANQGFVLFLAEVVVSLLIGIIDAIVGGIVIVGFLFGIIAYLVGLVFLGLSILGIYNALTGKAKELPVIGTIRILK